MTCVENNPHRKLQWRVALMSEFDRPERSLFSAEAAEQETIIEQFEMAFQSDSSPDLDRYLGEVPRETFVELMSVDMEIRLKRGEPVRTESYLTRFPSMASEPDVVVSLITTEFEFRRRTEGEISLDEYHERFPGLKQLIKERLATKKMSTEYETASHRLAMFPTIISGIEKQTTRDAYPADNAVGDRIRDYLLIENIGKGGMGAVYKATHERLGKTVAVKVLAVKDCRAEEAAGRFEQEMRSLGNLNHPNIVKATDAGVEDGKPFLVMEYLEGRDLGQLLRERGTLDIPVACELIRQAANAVGYLMENGLVHRDLKPSNLFLAQDVNDSSKKPVVKLLDLGLARRKFDERADRLSSAGQVVGTVDYLAPEQTIESDVDIRADLYSLGVTLYQLLAGETPFPNEKYPTAMKKLIGLVNDDPVPIQTVRPDVPEELAEIIQRLMEKDPDDRFSTPSEVAEAFAPFSSSTAIHEVLRGSPPTSNNESNTTESYESTRLQLESVPPKPWNRALKYGSIAAIVILAAGLLLRFKAAEGEWELKTLQPGQEVTLRQNGEEIHKLIVETKGQVVTAKIGTYEVLVRADGATIHEGKVTFRRNGQAIVELVKVFPPQLRAPGKRLIASESTEPISALALTARPTKIEGLKSWSIETRLHRGSVYLIEVSADGKLVATAGDDKTVRIWRTENFEPVQILYSNPPNEHVKCMAWSRDGRRLCCLCEHGATIYDTTTWQVVYAFVGRGNRYLGMHCEWSQGGLLMLNYFATGYKLLILDVDQGRVIRDNSNHLTGYVAAHWEADRERIRTFLRLKDGKTNKLVSWDVHANRIEDLGPYVTRAIYSPDFSRFVVPDQKAKLWIVKSRADDKTLCTIPMPKEQPQNAFPAWSPNGQYLSWRDHDERVQKIVNVETGKELPGSGQLTNVSVTCWSPDSKSLFLINRYGLGEGYEPNLRVIDIHSGDIRRHHVVQSSFGDTRSGGNRFDGPRLQSKILWSPDSTQILSHGHGFHRWNVAMGQFQKSVTTRFNSYWPSSWLKTDTIVGFGGHPSNLSVAWSHNLQTKVDRSKSGFGIFWGATNEARELVFLDEAKQTVNVVDSLTQRKIRSVKLREPHQIGRFERWWWGMVSPTGNRAATSSIDGPAKVWNLQNGQVANAIDVKTISQDLTEFSCPCFSPDDSRLLFQSGNDIFLWDLESNSLVTKLKTASNASLYGTVWINSDQFAHASTHQIKFFDRKGNLQHEWDDKGNYFGQLALSPDGSKIACLVGTYNDNRDWPFIQIRDLKTGAILSTHCLLSSQYHYDLPFSFGPTGHWHGPIKKELREALCYVAETKNGQRLSLTPNEFETQYGWKNDPEQVVTDR